jgi:hypothetical protein
LHDKNLRENRPRLGIQELEIAVLENQEYSEVYIKKHGFYGNGILRHHWGAIYESS